MKVVLACNFPRDEKLGSSRVPLRLAGELEKLGVDVKTIFAEDLPRVPGGARADLVTAPFRMAAALGRSAGEADVVDVAGFDAWAYAAWARRFRPGQAVVSRSNGLWYRALAAAGPAQQGVVRRALSGILQGQVLRLWERSSMVRSDVVLFGASGDGDEVVRNGWKTPEGVAIVAPGVDDFFESDVPLEARRDVAFVGTLMHRKGDDILARAMSRALADRPTLNLTIFGAGVTEEHARRAFDEAVRPRVNVPASIPSAQLARELGRYAVLVFPTRYEGFGLVVLEAMRAGLAVVVTPTGAGVDVVRDGETGLVVPIEDVPATAAAVGRLIDDDALRLRLARAGLEEARRRSWARTATELLAAYEHARALAARRAASK